MKTTKGALELQKRDFRDARKNQLLKILEDELVLKLQLAAKKDSKFVAKIRRDIISCSKALRVPRKPIAQVFEKAMVESVKTIIREALRPPKK